MGKNNTDLVALNAPFLPMFSRPSRSPSVSRGGTIYYPIALATAVSYAQNQDFKGVLANTTKTEKKLKFEAEIDLDNGLDRIIKYYSQINGGLR